MAGLPIHSGTLVLADRPSDDDGKWIAARTAVRRVRRSLRIRMAPSRRREKGSPVFAALAACRNCRSSAHGEQCSSSLGSSKLVLLDKWLCWVINRDAGACARVVGSLVRDELRPRRSTSPSRWRASRVCTSSRSRDARVMCRSRVMPCGLVCDHFYPKYIFGAPDSFCARPQLAPLHAVTGLPAHYFPHPLYGMLYC